jgi:hypothetical protein
MADKTTAEYAEYAEKQTPKPATRAGNPLARVLELD